MLWEFRLRKGFAIYEVQRIFMVGKALERSSAEISISGMKIMDWLLQHFLGWERSRMTLRQTPIGRLAFPGSARFGFLRASRFARSAPTMPFPCHATTSLAKWSPKPRLWGIWRSR